MLDLNMQSYSCYPLQTTCMKCKYCFSAKIVTRVNLLPRLQNVVVHDYSNIGLLLTLKWQHGEFLQIDGKSLYIFVYEYNKVMQ